MKHPYENEAYDKHGSKINELKSYIEELFCSRDKKLENYMKIYSKSFGKKLNYNSQMN